MSEELKTVIFATPSTTHSVCLDYLVSVIATDRLMVQNRFGVGHMHIGGDCYLWKVRSKIATRFLRDHPEATDLFFLDDDIGWEPGKVVEFLNRPEDILVGVYPKKNDELDFPLELMAGDDGQPIQKDGLYRALSAGAGFLRIKRHVLEKMAESAPRFKEDNGNGVEEYIGFFWEGIVDGWAWGEDKYFFEFAQQNGFETWADPNIKFTHRGGKTWKARLSDHVAKFNLNKEDAE